MIGNDIVDRAEARRASRWERPGFLAKVFTSAEQALIHEAADPFVVVWSLWSMKESAYKVYVQAGGKRFLNPARIACRLTAAPKGSFSGQVQIGAQRFFTHTRIETDYILSTAGFPALSAPTRSRVITFPKNNDPQQSQGLRQQLIRAVACAHQRCPASLHLRKTADGVPVLHDADGPMDISISLSHHGRFGAYVVEGL